MNLNKKDFEFIEHTADAKFKAYGKNLNEVLENAAYATFRSMLDLSDVEPTLKKEINLSSSELDELLFNWISELIYYFDAENIVFKDFNAQVEKTKQGYELFSKVYGEKINPKKHKFETEVKAITYHDLEIEEKNGYQVQVVLDT
ncbi:MAG: Archease SHS2 domain containing protein involved in activation of tRNA ligase RtcB [Candidatus Methanohalarchaeum thermophilum]|uniref:Protein archease n=1 Tax=Methanohalarchaeum thermophilum TaxID=1903181 RepID=A0A1Q6DVR4_METT1|nr:MAG: Archease SHS2 domain containing protein involved in activation of tRNA ligase RtcB [Candidatus Methanohalarchaeum thermophilum]